MEHGEKVIESLSLTGNAKLAQSERHKNITQEIPLCGKLCAEFYFAFPYVSL